MAVYKKEYFSNKVEDVVQVSNTSIRSRYDTKVRLKLDNNNLIIRNLKHNDLVASKTDADLIHTVTAVEDKRPDLIANSFYKDARLYWIILAANGLNEADELRKGSIIRIPSKSSMYKILTK